MVSTTGQSFPNSEEKIMYGNFKGWQAAPVESLRNTILQADSTGVPFRIKRVDTFSLYIQ